MLRRLTFILVFCVASNNIGMGQDVHTASGKAMKLYSEGVRLYEFLDLTNAERNFRAALSIDKKFYEAYLMLGDLLSKQRRFIEAAENYRAAVKIDSLSYKPIFFSLGMAEMMSGDYNRALVHFNVYLQQAGMSPQNRKTALDNVRNCEFAIEAIRNPVPFNPQNAGPGINTIDDEYWPSITADGSKLIFTRQQAQTANMAPTQEDFYISLYASNAWQKALNAGTPLNTRQNEGAQSLASDGRYMYFTACDRQGGMGSCDLYFSYYSDGRWSQPSNVGPPVNSRAWESQPSISADGKMLFFSSSRAGGKGGKDIWIAKKLDNGNWSKPFNPGFTINTEGDEMSPFIHFDGKTLYFSSNGRTGMGGFDIFRTILHSDSIWENPQNLGYPINTYNDETGLVIGSDGRQAYFSSIREKQYGKDIFYFDLYESARPEPVSYIKGKVYDKVTGKLIKAEYELLDLTSGKTILSNTTDGSGEFLICLPSGLNYGINVSKSGYLFYSENFLFDGEHTIAEPFIKTISLSPLNVGEKMQLSNIFYEIDSWELKKESIAELNNLVKLLKHNQDIVIEIGGYTDSTGTDEYNIVLSEKRALSVVDYLIQNGIPSERLTHKGYGNSDPIGDNVTYEGRKLNRRTEAKIIETRKVVPQKSPPASPGMK